jgi:hypothetical protein
MVKSVWLATVAVPLGLFSFFFFLVVVLLLLLLLLLVRPGTSVSLKEGSFEQWKGERAVTKNDNRKDGRYVAMK